MRTIPLRAVVLVSCLTVPLAGCVSQTEPLAELPVHDLDLSAAGPLHPTGTVLEAHSSEWLGSPDPWAVSSPRAWRHIVIHHSATDDGNAAEFDAHHRQRGWDGLGYHFVIDNGKGGPDGRIEVGRRWRLQKVGAHTGKTPGNEYNKYGIGICLVGDFRRRMPSAAQLDSLDRLVAYLVKMYKIPPNHIIGHCDAPNAATECPGAMLHRYILRTLRSRAMKQHAYRD